MKKILALLLVITMAASLFAACGDITIKVEQNKETQNQSTTNPDTSGNITDSGDQEAQGEKEDMPPSEPTGETEDETTGETAEEATKEVTEETTEENTEETADTVPEPAYTAADIIFNTRYKNPDGVCEITMRCTGEIWNCYKGNIPLEQIVWVSDDATVVTVENGVVTAVGAGATRIHAIWGEYDVVCIVRSLGSNPETGISGSGGSISEG